MYLQYRCDTLMILEKTVVCKEKEIKTKYDVISL